MVLEIAPEEGLRGGHHADVGHRRDEALAVAAALVGAVEDGEVLGPQVRGALDGHGAADVVVGALDVLGAEAERGEMLKVGSASCASLRPSAPLQKSSPST